MKIQRKLLLSYVMIVVLFASIGTVITLNTMKMSELQANANLQVDIGNYANAYQQGMDLKKYANIEANVDLQSAQRNTLAAQQITDAAETFLLNSLPKDSELYTKFMTCYEINHDIIDGTVAKVEEILNTNDVARMDELPAMGVAITNGFTQISGVMTQFQVAILENVDTATKESQEYANFSILLSSIGVTTIAVISVVMALVIGNRITSPLKKLTDIAGKVSMGNLEHEVKFDTKDEISELGEAFQRMINAFKMSNAMNNENVEQEKT